MVYKYCDPISDHYAYTNDLYLQQKHDQKIEDEMQEYKTQAFDRLRLIVHPDYVKEFSSILAFAFFEQTPEATRISNSLNLDQRHFYSIENDFDEMKKILSMEAKYEFDYE